MSGNTYHLVSSINGGSQLDDTDEVVSSLNSLAQPVMCSKLKSRRLLGFGQDNTKKRINVIMTTVACWHCSLVSLELIFAYSMLMRKGRLSRVYLVRKQELLIR